jgi:hypothetical protein
VASESDGFSGVGSAVLRQYRGVTWPDTVTANRRLNEI